MPHDSGYVVILALLRVFINDAIGWKDKWDYQEHIQEGHLDRDEWWKFEKFMKNYSQLVDTMITNNVLLTHGSEVANEILDIFHLVHHGGEVNLSMDVSNLCRSFMTRKRLIRKLHKFHLYVLELRTILDRLVKQSDQ